MIKFITKAVVFYSIGLAVSCVVGPLFEDDEHES